MQLNEKQVSDLLKKMDYLDILAEIRQDGLGHQIYQQLKTQTSISAYFLLQFVQIEQYGRSLQFFFSKKF